MRQFPLSAVPAAGPEGHARAVLGPKEARYLLRSLRLEEGARFPALDPEGGVWEAVLAEASRDRCILALERGAPRSPERSPSADEPGGDAMPPPDGADIALFQCLPKGSKIDLIVRQAVEAGVSLVVTVESEHCVARARGEEWRKDRLERVLREAVSQCGRRAPVRVRGPVPLAAVPDTFAEFAAGRSSLGLFFHEKPLAQASLHGYLDADPRVVGAVVGPEGGLSPAETALLLDAGFKGAWLGPNVLRAETAALYAVAAVQTLSRERQSWRTNQ